MLTLESARQFLSQAGLLLFTPRPQYISSPAPTFVEATLGREAPAPSPSELENARALLASLITEGSAVPLNLLGAPSSTPDMPDFVASASAFSYVFTLRGEKAFKQLPSTSGATKVSPLSLNTYTLLLEHGPKPAGELATLLGKEVTEAAVLRSLNELLAASACSPRAECSRRSNGVGGSDAPPDQAAQGWSQRRPALCALSSDQPLSLPGAARDRAGR